MTPEAQARLVIDARLQQAGWIVQDYKAVNLRAEPGVAVREYPCEGGTRADYVLFADGQAVGVIEAKRDSAGENLPPHLLELLASLEDYLLSLGDDVQRKELKLYAAFKRLKNFGTVVPQKTRLLLYLHVDPAPWLGKLAGASDVSQKGHWGTGDLELPLSTQADLDAAKPVIVLAYEGRAVASPSPVVA